MPSVQKYSRSPLDSLIEYSSTPSAVIREGDYKLVEFFGDHISEADSVYRTEPKIELYNLVKDVGEQHDISKQMPDKVAAMRRKLRVWIDSTGNRLPTKNPQYDATQPLAESRGQPPVRGGQ